MQTAHIPISLVFGLSTLLAGPSHSAEFVGTVVDADTRQPLAARVYVQRLDGDWLFVDSAAEHGSALAYREQWVPMPDSVEQHTTISAHPFRIELAPGEYRVTIERGKEYLPLTAAVRVADRPLRSTFSLQRLIDMRARGWFSGETHVHRRIEELPNVMLAEDLNVAFPVTFWTIDAFSAPGLAPSPLRRQGPSPFGPRVDHGSRQIQVDPTHVIFPRNTEYEVFNIDGRRHTLGAIFILNHKSIFQTGMPPVAEIAAQAHREGALLDLDKHSWPWAMMLVPIAKVDLYELANNSVWRTKFGFRRSSVEPPEFMRVERDAGGMTEWGWLNFGFENYYTLLNCGFRLQPTAGTASGVHPVPLGHSRVYVHLGESFTAEQWIEGLRRGRSFVTTGPMLLATLDNHHPGHVFAQPQSAATRYRLHIESVSARPLDRLEIVVNGRVQQTIRPEPPATLTTGSTRGHVFEQDVSIAVDESSWVAIRSFAYQADGRVRFAHTAPWHIEVAGQPVRPRRNEVQFLIQRVAAEIERNKDLLPESALAEFRAAQQIYEAILSRARED